MLSGLIWLSRPGNDDMPIEHAADHAFGYQTSDPVGADGCDCRRAPHGAVSEAGGFGILGGGYGERAWLEAETAKLKQSSGALRHRLHHLEPRKAAGTVGHRAGRAAARDHAVVWRSQAVCAAYQVGGRAVDLPGAERGRWRSRRSMPAPTSLLRRVRGGRPRRVPHHHRFVPAIVDLRPAACPSSPREVSRMDAGLRR